MKASSLRCAVWMPTLWRLVLRAEGFCCKVVARSSFFFAKVWLAPFLVFERFKRCKLQRLLVLKRLKCCKLHHLLEHNKFCKLQHLLVLNASNAADYSFCWSWNASNAVNESVCRSRKVLRAVVYNISWPCNVPLLQLIPWEKSGRLDLGVRIRFGCGLDISSFLAG